MTSSALLTPRWYPLRYHKVQDALVRSPARFKVVPAGRRSGKTERAKREGIRLALIFPLSDGWFVFAAPTRDQAKHIWWEDLKRLVPSRFVVRIWESELRIRLINGVDLQVIGLDKPQRAEGRPLDFICLDEYADMKPEVWDRTIRPALSTDGRPPGRAWLIGKPKGRNHYYELYRKAIEDTTGEWAGFTWVSADILSAKEIASAKADMDRISYEQEFEAKFTNFTGRAYYDFEAAVHARTALEYQPNLPLDFCFDFNRSPGVAAVCQEQERPKDRTDCLDIVTACIGEVFIPTNSTTPAVCRRLIADWTRHEGEVRCFGDATGGNKGSAKIAGSDWDIVRDYLTPVFADRLSFNVQRANPEERVRVNAMNRRIKQADGKVGFLVDPKKARHVVDDFEGVVVLEGGTGEIDKDKTPTLTHLSDGVGYRVWREYPAGGGGLAAEDLW